MKLILNSIVFFLSGIYLSIAQSPAPADSIRISFVGNGEIQKAISSGGEIPANTDDNIIFLNKWNLPT